MTGAGPFSTRIGASAEDRKMDDVAQSGSGTDKMLSRKDGRVGGLEPAARWFEEHQEGQPAGERRAHRLCQGEKSAQPALQRRCHTGHHAAEDRFASLLHVPSL